MGDHVRRTALSVLAALEAAHALGGVLTMAIRLGMLTPSSNTVCEPAAAAMRAGLPDVYAHFSRFSVTEISLGERALGQFALEPMLQAAEHLADARVDVICWNGTSAGWLGLAADAELLAAMTARTGIPPQRPSSRSSRSSSWPESGATAWSHSVRTRSRRSSSRTSKRPTSRTPPSGTPASG